MRGTIVSIIFLLFPFSLFAKETQNSFGFLSGAMDNENFEYLNDVAAGWMRPHPGPAVWEMIQTENGGEYDWNFMDGIVEKAQEHQIQLLITIWPFASWDQVRMDDSDRCKVSDEDQFLPNDEGKDKGRVEYLPYYRCNPYDWNEYERWVTAMVERYDGDGRRDMPDLLYGIRYWEVMNEPDLSESVDLDFYKDDSDDYYRLLRRTYWAIKEANRKAKVLIAGAAGSSREQEGYFLDYYDTIFSAHPKAKKYFDVGNIHHISPEGEGDFNVGAYKRLLQEHGIQKPIWVTEAGAQGVNEEEEQIGYIKSNTREAIQSGAKRIFYIHYSFGTDYSDAATKRAKKIYQKLIKKWD